MMEEETKRSRGNEMRPELKKERNREVKRGTGGKGEK